MLKNPKSNMRIAVCFSGQVRTGHIVAPNILRYIGDLLPQCDFFVHTWDEECIGTGHGRRLQLNDVSPEVHTTSKLTNRDKVAEFLGHYMPRMVTYEQYDLQPTKALWGGRRFDPLDNKWYVSMWRSLSEANQLKKTYSQKNAFVYDYTVRIRPDLVFDPDKSLGKDLDQITHDNMFLTGDQYNLWSTHRHTKLEDIFWLGPTRVMDAVCDYSHAYTHLVKNIDDPRDPNYRDWQFHSAWWVTECLGIEFRPLRDNRMRIYYDLDLEQARDHMRPNFGIDQYNPEN